MNNNLLRQIVLCSKKTLKYFLLQLLVIQVVVAESSSSQSMEDYSVTINVTNQKLVDVLSELEKQTDFTFAYNQQVAKDNSKISISTTSDLKTILQKITEQVDFDFKRVNNNIYVTHVNSRLNIVEIIEFEEDVISSNFDIQISGKVTDDNGDPLPGASVTVVGTTIGTVTDLDGNYSMTVPDGATLIFSYIGFEAMRVPVDNRTQINIALQPDMSSLEEVVVIGYGSQRKSDLTGSVGSVSGEALQERPAASLNQALSGRIQGVNVSVNSGRPGGRANIRIRGNTSVSIANDPLYVIDGVIIHSTGLANGSTPIDYINPNDIESVEVLKDASATAIYGARGANGVILVTTKRGTKKGGMITYDTDFSVGVLPRKIPLLNSEEFLRVEEIAYSNAQKYDPVGWQNGIYRDPRLKRTDPRLFDSNGNPLHDTDWQDESFRQALTHNHQLAFTGGSEKDNYGIYLGHRDEQGIMHGSWLKRYSARFVFDSQIKDWLKVGGSLSYNDQKESQVDPLGAGGIIAMRQVLEALPIIPVRYGDGRWAGNEDYPGMEGGNNPLHVVEDRVYELSTQTVLGNVYANFYIAPGLEFRSIFATNIINQRIDYYGGRELNFIARNQRGDASVTNDRHNSWQFENYLTYNKELDENQSINALLGISWQHVDRFQSTARSQDFADDYFKFNNLGAGANVFQTLSGTTAYGLNSYFGRFNYNLMEKYLVTFTGRIDGSSKFGEANRYAVFPSAAVAWRISEEDFLKNSRTVSNLKLRSSYGVTGNSEIPAFQALAGMGNYTVIFNDQRAIGLGVNRLANPDLRWERTFQTDIGLELGLFDNRLTLELDLYQKLTRDMLLNAPVPSSSGYTQVTQNIGSMENRGVEIAVNSVNVVRNNFKWDTHFNLSINRNRVLELTGGADIFSGSTIIREGEPVGSFFGFVHQGTWNTDEADIAAQFGKLPGDIKYQDVNGDGAINDNDRVIIGQGIPRGFGTLMNTFSYKNFELLVDLQFMYGNNVLWRSKHSAEDRQGIANSFRTVLDAWTPENQDTNIAELRPLTAGYNTFNDSDRSQDGSFLRGRNLLFAYTFTPHILERLQISRLRAFVSVQNFFLATRFQGYDPEVSTSGSPFDQGVDLYSYPKPRVFMLGLNIAL